MTSHNSSCLWQRTNSSLTSLPRELLLTIFSYLDKQALHCLENTTEEFRDLVNSSVVIWQRKIHHLVSAKPDLASSLWYVNYEEIRNEPTQLKHLYLCLDKVEENIREGKYRKKEISCMDATLGKKKVAPSQEWHEQRSYRGVYDMILDKGRICASVYDTIQIWDTRDYRLTHMLTKDILDQELHSHTTCFALCGQYVVCGTENGYIRILNINTEETVAKARVNSNYVSDVVVDTDFTASLPARSPESDGGQTTVLLVCIDWFGGITEWLLSIPTEAAAAGGAASSAEGATAAADAATPTGAAAAAEGVKGRAREENGGAPNSGLKGERPGLKGERPGVRLVPVVHPGDANSTWQVPVILQQREVERQIALSPELLVASFKCHLTIYQRGNNRHGTSGRKGEFQMSFPVLGSNVFCISVINNSGVSSGGVNGITHNDSSISSSTESSISSRTDSSDSGIKSNSSISSSSGLEGASSSSSSRVMEGASSSSSSSALNGAVSFSSSVNSSSSSNVRNGAGSCNSDSTVKTTSGGSSACINKTNLVAFGCKGERAGSGPVAGVANPAYSPPRIVYFCTKFNDPVISLQFSLGFLFLGDTNGDIHVIDIRDIVFTEREQMVKFGCDVDPSRPTSGCRYVRLLRSHEYSDFVWSIEADGFRIFSGDSTGKIIIHDFLQFEEEVEEKVELETVENEALEKVEKEVKEVKEGKVEKEGVELEKVEVQCPGDVRVGSALGSEAGGD